MPDVMADFPSANALVRYRDVVYAIIIGEIERRIRSIPIDRARTIYEVNFQRLNELEGLRLDALLAGSQPPLSISVPEMGRVLDDLSRRCRKLFLSSDQILTPALQSEYQGLSEALHPIDDLVFALNMSHSAEGTAVPTTTESIERPKEPTGPLPSEPVSAAALAKMLGMDGVNGAMDKFLSRYREKCPDCYVINDHPRRGEPTYLYRPDEVLPALKAWQNSRQKK